MAGERYASITLQATLSHSDNRRGLETQNLRFTLGQQVLTITRGANPGQFIVPDPDDVGESYAQQAVQNLLNVLGPRIFALGLPYVVSGPRVGTPATMPEPVQQGATIPVIEFDILATAYGKYNLGFAWESDTGWAIKSQQTNVSPIFVTATVTDAGAYGASDGAIALVATGGDSDGFFFYTWSDGVKGASRQNLSAGDYTCVVTDAGGSGASTSITRTVRSDARLEVQVATTPDTITLSVSGGLAPYTYAWADGPTTATRPDLKAGTYACVVTDARGTSQRIEVTLSAYHYFWSRNAITLALDAGDAYRDDPGTKPNLSFLCEVWLEKNYLSGTFEPVGPALEQPADREGRTTFEVQALLNAFLAYHVPAAGSTAVERADPLFRRFYLRHREQYGVVPEPTNALSLERNYVVLGGLNFYEARQATWFSDYQAKKLPFLTWEPASKLVLDDQPEYLYYMVTGDPGAFELQVRVKYSDNSEDLLVRPGRTDVRDFEVYCLPVGYAGLRLAGLSTAERQVVQWDVYVSGLDGTPALSEGRSFRRDRRTFPHRRYFLFATSLGGMATYAALGEAQTDVEVTGEEASLTLAPGYDPLLGDTAVQERVLRPLLKVAAGKRTQAQLLASQDFFLSRRVLLLAGTRWVPGVVKAKTANLLDESKLVLTQEFDFYLPTEHLYTPAL